MSSPKSMYECTVCKTKRRGGEMIHGYRFCSTRCLIQSGKSVRVVRHPMMQGPKIRPIKKPRVKKPIIDPPSGKFCLKCHGSIGKSRCESKFCSRRCRNTYKAPPLNKVVPKTNKPLVRIDLWSDENKERWQKLRYDAFLKYGRKCMLCGATNKLHVDHIKPKAVFPELCWDINNLQVLCEDCNMGKGFRDQTDWRKP